MQSQDQKYFIQYQYKSSYPLTPKACELLKTNQKLQKLLLEIYQRNTQVIPFNNLEIDPNDLGQGATSVVSLGQYRYIDSFGNTQIQKCACKRIINIRNLEDEVLLKTLEGILNEVIQLQGLNQKNYPNIIRLLGVSLDVELIILLEYCPQGNLKQMLSSQQLDLEGKLDKIIQTVEAIKVLHQNNIAHLDIKPDNILIDQNGIAKLTDFGISKELNYREIIQTMGASQNQGTPGFCAPEIYKNIKLVTKKSDI